MRKHTALLLSVAVAACSTTGTMQTAESGGEVAIRRDARALRDGMHRLWTDHVVWTRGYIVAAVAGDPSASAAAARLMKNQEDIGNAIAPFYGSTAGTRLTALLKDHINIAVDLLAAAKARDDAKITDANTRWHQNAADIAGFLASANPNWTREGLRMMLDEHLRLTTEEAKARLDQRWSDDSRLFDEILTQALHMADALTDGIAKQFPNKV